MIVSFVPRQTLRSMLATEGRTSTLGGGLFVSFDGNPARGPQALETVRKNQQALPPPACIVMSCRSQLAQGPAFTLLRKLRRDLAGRSLAGVTTTNLVQSTGQKGGAQMNGKGSLTTGVALALMLGIGLTATVPAVGLGTASAQDQAQATAAGQFFRVNWTVGPGAPGESRITGYVYNDSGDPADQVQIRITQLDASGQPVTSFVKPIDDIVPGFDRSYFDVQVPGQAASYRVAVESFSLLEGVK